MVLDPLTPVGAAAVAQPEDGGRGVGRMVVGVFHALRPLGAGEEAHGGALVAGGALVELLGDLGVGVELALLDRLLELGVLLQPVADGAAADADDGGQVVVGGAQHGDAPGEVAVFGLELGVGAACAHGADPLAVKVGRDRPQNCARESSASCSRPRESRRALTTCRRDGPATASSAAATTSIRCGAGHVAARAPRDGG